MRMESHLPAFGGARVAAQCALPSKGDVRQPQTYNPEPEPEDFSQPRRHDLKAPRLNKRRLGGALGGVNKKRGMTSSLSISNLSAFFADAENEPECPCSPPAPSRDLVRSFSAMDVREIPTAQLQQGIKEEKRAEETLRPWERFARWQKLHPSASRHEARAFIEHALHTMGTTTMTAGCGSNTCSGVARSQPRAAI